MADGCEKNQALLERYLDEDLERAERSRLELHLGECSLCGQRLATLKTSAELLREHLDRATDAADFSAFEEKVLAGIEHQRRPPLSERLGVWIRESFYHHRNAWSFSLAAAAIVLALLLPVLVGDHTPTVTPLPGGDQRGLGHPGDVQTAQVDNEVIIDSMEYAGERSMIYTVSKNNTTVIWMYDFDRASTQDSQGDEI